MLSEREKRFNKILRDLADSLDIPPSKYKQALERYEAVGRWLEGGDYLGIASSSEFYPQGSFRLGTVVRPMKDGKDADYDIDLVSELQLEKAATTPRGLKHMIGDRLREKEAYKRMLNTEGRRCWTLVYAEEDGIGFHMDILPALPESPGIVEEVVRRAGHLANHAIAITDKDKGSAAYSWATSNPRGYAEWFSNQNLTSYGLVEANERKMLLDRHPKVFASIEEVTPEYVRTPLQRAIQILKGHRNKRFLGHEWEEDKPISMIITTLAAQAYENEGDVCTALTNIVEKLGEYAVLLRPGGVLTEDVATPYLIEKRQHGWYIPNPVEPDENFADRWNDPGSHRAEAFFQWVEWAKVDIIEGPMGMADPGRIRRTLAKVLGIAMPTVLVPRRSPSPEQPKYPKVRISNPSKPWGC